jgi:hypothetical protein
MGVDDDPGGVGSRLLALPGAQYPGADRRRGVALEVACGEQRDRHARHLHVQVDAVEQGTRDARAVALERTRGALTALGVVAQVAARAPLRCLFAM